MTDDDCRTCGRFYPGIGCLSEAEMFCGCCYYKTTILDRLKHFMKVVRHMLWFIIGR